MYFPDLTGLFRALYALAALGVVSSLVLVAIGTVWIAQHVSINF